MEPAGQTRLYPAARTSRRWRRAIGFADSARGGGGGSADRMRERRESATGQRRRPAKGDRRARSAGSEPRANRPAITDREFTAGRAGRRFGLVAGGLGRGRVVENKSGRHSATG